ncbi:MAG: hypothetical protein FD127_3733 [Acidimicrobiaceae bacterium]|nr:MAG: hypothetical protein FD127_3733 [Acidimicrobiaceae bacterium]
MDPAVRFAALVSGPPPGLRLDHACSLLAAAFTGDYHYDRVMRSLDELAAMVTEKSLGGVLAAMRGRLTGDRENYFDAKNSFIDAVLVRGLGLPITLSVIAIEIGRRVDVPIVGVSLPSHFIVRETGRRSHDPDPHPQQPARALLPRSGSEGPLRPGGDAWWVRRAGPRGA